MQQTLTSCQLDNIKDLKMIIGLPRHFSTPWLINQVMCSHLLYALFLCLINMFPIYALMHTCFRQKILTEYRTPEQLLAPTKCQTNIHNEASKGTGSILFTHFRIQTAFVLIWRVRIKHLRPLTYLKPRTRVWQEIKQHARAQIHLKIKQFDGDHKSVKWKISLKVYTESRVSCMKAN